MVIVNERVAQRFWPNAEPIGQSIKLGGRRSPQPWGTVVGVTKSAAGHTWYEPSSEVFDLYVPFDSAFPQAATFAWLSFYVRTASDPKPLSESLRKAIWAVDKDQPILFVRTMGETLYRTGFTRRAQAMLMGIFAALSVLLSAVGIYSLVSHAVTQRTREIGIRMALGAQRSDVVRLVLRNGMILALIGIAAGLFASFALTGVIANQLYAIQSTDPVTLVSVTALLMGITLLASYIPARRATKVDPMQALRYE